MQNMHSCRRKAATSFAPSMKTLRFAMFAGAAIFLLSQVNASDEDKSSAGSKSSASFETVSVEQIRKHQKIPAVFKNFKATVQCTRPSRQACTKKTKLVVLVLTRTESFKQRQLIRRSWLAHVPRHVSYMFLVGRPSKKALEKLRTNREDMLERLEEENGRHKDLLRTNVVDLYGRNVALKLFAGYSWLVENCPSAKFVLKIDDDTVVSVRRLLFWIRHKFAFQAKKAPKHCVAWGMLLGNEPPIRDRRIKWYQPESEFPDPLYPLYLNGPVILFTLPFLDQVLAQSSKFNLMRMEDVLFTGVLANAAGCPRIPVPMHFRFGHEGIGSGCKVMDDGTKWPLVIGKNFPEAPDIEENWRQVKNARC